MKYLKEFKYITEGRSEENHKKDLDIILSTHEIIKQDIDRILNNHKIKYEFYDCSLWNLDYGKMFDISDNEKYKDTNYDYYLSELIDQESIFGDCELKYYKLRYSLRIKRSNPIVNGIQSLIDDLSKKYTDAEHVRLYDKIHYYIEFHYNMQKY